MALSDIVEVIIQRENISVSKKGFGTLLILTGDEANDKERVGTYANITEVADNYPADSEAYAMAQAAFGGDIKPQQIKIGYQQRVTVPATQAKAVGTISDLASWQAVTDGSITVTVDGGTPQDITGLDFSTITTIDEVSGVIQASLTDATVTNDDTKITFLSQQVGAASLIELTSGSGGTDLLLTHITDVVETPGEAEDPLETITEALDLIREIDDDWYAIGTDLNTEAEILEIAGYIQALKKIYFANSEDEAILDPSATDDIASQLLDGSFNRTALIYEQGTHYSGIAWAGQYLSYDPGTLNWAHKTLKGVTASTLSSTQRNAALGKLCNIYTTIAGRSITQFGFTSEMGTYIDIIRAIDWIEARIQEGVYGRLVSTAKIPYNDAGFTVIASEVEAVLQIAEADVVINPGWTVTVPRLEEIPEQDRANRHFSGTEFTAELAGAVNTVTIHGYIQ
jgi:hypothetical protein